MGENKKPAIRFRGFTDAWEQRKLGDLLDVSTGKLDANAMVEDGEYDFYTSGIKKFRIDIPAFEGPAITIAGNGATVGYMHLADGKFNAYQRTYVLEGFQADRQFLYSEIGNRLPRKIAEEARTGNIPYIVMDMLTGLNISLPVAEEEQRKIGTFFSSLDNLITLHQRKYDKLQNIKKSMLEKMFPKNGMKTPEVRFKGFTDAWEQRKLGELTDVYDGTHQTPQYTDDGIMFLSVENIKTLQSQKYISEEAFKTEFKVFPEKGDVLMTRIGDIGTANVFESNEPTAYYVSLALLKCKELDPYFLKESIYSETVKKDLWHRTLHIAFPKKINKNEIEKVQIPYPESRLEQERIGTFFRNLDNLITLHQRELDKLQNIKKSCLKKIFV